MYAALQTNLLLCSTNDACNDTSFHTSTRPVESLRRVHGRGDDVQLAAPPDFFNLLASQSPRPFLKFTDFISNVHAVSDAQRGIPERGDARLRGGDRSLCGGDNLGLLALHRGNLQIKCERVSNLGEKAHCLRANESVRAVPSDKCLDLSILCDAEATPSSGVNTTTIGGSASSSNVVFIVTWNQTRNAK